MSRSHTTAGVEVPEKGTAATVRRGPCYTIDLVTWPEKMCDPTCSWKDRCCFNEDNGFQRDWR